MIDNTSIGDSIIKVKSENLVYIKKPDSSISEFFFTRIPMKNRMNLYFPTEWKNKWMESSVFDTINRN